MKFLLIILSLVITTIASANNIPTPQYAVSINFGADTTKWKMAYKNGSEHMLLVEFTPNQQPIKSWKEMVSQEIIFVDVTIDEYMHIWEKKIKEADPNVKLTLLNKNKQIVTLTYQSKEFNEFSIRKYIKKDDAIYSISYNTRLEIINKKRIELWKNIINTTKIIPNPHYKTLH